MLLQRRGGPADRPLPLEPAAQRLARTSRRGSGGAWPAMAMSALSAPVYLKSFGAALLRRPSRFVVTPKGGERQLPTGC